MPAQRDEPSAPPEAENDDERRGIEVALRATGWLVPAFGAGHEPSLRHGPNCCKAENPKKRNKMLAYFKFM